MSQARASSLSGLAVAKIERMRSPTTRLRSSFLAYPRSPAALAVGVHPLRVTDALPLAAAFPAAERRPPSLEMVTLDDLPMQLAGGICNDRSDTGRLICWRCILFSAEYRFYLGKNYREASSCGNASAKFERCEIPLFSCRNGNIVGRRCSFRFAQWVCFQPQSSRGRKRIDCSLLPPQAFLHAAMNLTVMRSA